MDGHAFTLGLRQRSDGVWTFEGGVLPGHCCFLKNLAHCGCLKPANLGVPEMEEAEDSYAWLLH